MSEIGWNFPPTNGGMEAGINDAGIVTFDGHPLESLAREIIQNSVDARLSKDEPVKITFELHNVDKTAFHGADLAEHLRACADEWKRDEKASTALQRAKEVLDQETVTFLRITDANTTGLAGESWKTLVKMSGASFKPQDGAGGSFGVGKSAPFAVSPLRTVCYWSAFEEQGEMTERFQGKAVLVKHDHDYGNGLEPAQNIGFFGRIRQCEALSGSEIPNDFQPPAIAPRPSTSVWVAGFSPTQHEQRWQDAIAQSIVESFFYAIDRGDLDVLLEPDEDQPDGAWQIDASTIGELLTQYESQADDESKIDDQIERSRLYWEMVHDREPDEVMHEARAGIKGAKLWIATEDSYPGRQLPNRLALIRGTGMLITDDQKRGWPGFRGLQDYAAVCLIDDPASNELLRRMENPAHDQFESERLDEADRERGQRALSELRRWIREQLAKYASPPKVEVTEDVNELLEFLYAEDSSPFANGNSKDDEETQFGEPGEIRSKPRKRVVRPNVLVDDDDLLEDGEGEDGDDLGEHGGSGGNEGGGGGGAGFGPGEGEGKGGSGTRGGGKGRRPMVLANVRVIHNAHDPYRSRIVFTTNETASARFEVSEAGDYSAISRDDVTVYDNTGVVVDPASEIQVTAGERREFELVGQQPLDDAAWQIAAFREVPS